MREGAKEQSTEQDWRLEAELQVADAGHALRELVGRLRGPDVVDAVEAAVGDDVVITHDGKLLFAYAAQQATLEAARTAIERVLAQDGIAASVRTSHWDEERESWRQIDPPPSAEAQRSEKVAQHDAEAVQTRTIVASVGRMIRAEFEQSIQAWAGQLGLECKIIEHPHLLTTQVGFTVTGPKRKLDEFSRGLAAEERATIRAETTVMMSPL